MSNSTSLPDFSAALLGLLLSSKHQLMDVAKDYDLTFIQASTLLLSNSEQPKPMKAFQKLYHCDASNITGIVDGLEEKKLVKRGEQLDDRRVKVVLITPTGIAVQKQLVAEMVRLNEEIMSVLTPEEVTQLRTILPKLSQI